MIIRQSQFSLGCLLALLLISGCKGATSTTTAGLVLGPTPVPSIGPRNIKISWAANHEKGVNSPNGGYKVYYSQTSGFSIANGTMINVPFLPGSTMAPTSVLTPKLAPGTYYFKVVGYSSLTAIGAASPQTSVTVP